MIPRVADSEPAVQHAMLALASLHEESVKDQGPGSRGHSFALTQYNKAIKHVQDRIGNGQSERIILLTCVLFICVEFIRGNAESALDHLQSGMRILQMTR